MVDDGNFSIVIEEMEKWSIKDVGRIQQWEFDQFFLLRQGILSLTLQPSFTFFFFGLEVESWDPLDSLFSKTVWKSSRLTYLCISSSSLKRKTNFGSYFIWTSVPTSAESPTSIGEGVGFDPSNKFPYAARALCIVSSISVTHFPIFWRL